MFAGRVSGSQSMKACVATANLKTKPRLCSKMMIHVRSGRECNGMRIINQARTLSINFDAYNVQTEDENITCTDYTNKRTLSLGSYRTCKRAKEVFREIHEKFMGLPFDDEPNVFYMPED